MIEQSYASAEKAIFSARAKSFKPRNHVSVSDWSDLHIVLSSKGSSEHGPFRTDRNPILREVMNCFSTRSRVQDVVVMFPIQIGKTTISVNVLAYLIIQDPSPIGVYLPAQSVADAWIDQKWQPILENCQILKDSIQENSTRQTSNRRNFKDFLGGVLFIESASNPVSAKSKSIKILIVDEVDEFANQYTSGDDPLAMLSERNTTFAKYKRLFVSTPTVKGVSRIEYLYNKSTMERFYIACPHCGHEQHLIFEGLVYSK
jgi:phage terminase large subunit GpA-like protein